MTRARRGTLFIRIAVLFLLICLAVLFLAASIMSRTYAEGPDNSSIHPAACNFRLTS
jgi:hypothetical protein